MARLDHTNTRWFKWKLEDAGISQRRLAKELGLDPSAVSLMLRGRRRMQLHEAVAIARLTGVPVADVVRHAGVRAAAVVWERRG